MAGCSQEYYYNIMMMRRSKVVLFTMGCARVCVLCIIKDDKMIFQTSQHRSHLTHPPSQLWCHWCFIGVFFNRTPTTASAGGRFGSQQLFDQFDLTDIQPFLAGGQRRYVFVVVYCCCCM